MGLLSILIVGSGLYFSDQERVRFERKAADDIRAKMIDGVGDIQIKTNPSLFAGFNGELHSTTISASNFSLDELPLFTEPDRSQSGRIGNLEIKLSNFMLRKLRVSELYASIPECRYDFGLAKSSRQIRLSKSGQGFGWVKLTENDLADYIVKKYREIKRCTVKLDGNRVWVEGYGEFLIINTSFAVIADIGVEEGTKLVLKNTKVYFDWIRADENAVNGILKIMNPVVDLKKDMGLYDAVEVEKVRAMDGILTASGKTKIPIKPSTD